MNAFVAVTWGRGRKGAGKGATWGRHLRLEWRPEHLVPATSAGQGGGTGVTCPCGLRRWPRDPREAAPLPPRSPLFPSPTIFSCTSTSSTRRSSQWAPLAFVKGLPHGPHSHLLPPGGGCGRGPTQTHVPCRHAARGPGSSLGLADPSGHGASGARTSPSCTPQQGPCAPGGPSSSFRSVCFAATPRRQGGRAFAPLGLTRHLVFLRRRGRCLFCEERRTQLWRRHNRLCDILSKKDTLILL